MARNIYQSSDFSCKSQASSICSLFAYTSIDIFLGKLQVSMDLYIGYYKKKKAFKILDVCLKHSEVVPLTNEFFKLKSKSHDS